MNNSFLLCGVTNKNLYNKDKKISDSINISMFEKTLEELNNKRQSLLRMREKIDSDHFVIRNTYLKTDYGILELAIGYIRSDIDDTVNNSELQDIKHFLRRIYELKSSRVNLTNFSHRYKGDVDFWWDINNDIMWSFDTRFMLEYLMENIKNSTNIITGIRNKSKAILTEQNMS